LLTVRAAQLRALESELHRERLEGLCRHLRAHFPDALAATDQTALIAGVESAVKRARRYELTSLRDVARYLNLAVVYGWDFDRQAEHAWMRELLEDRGVTNPSSRLSLLVDRCIRRRGVEAENRRLRQSFDLERLG